MPQILLSDAEWRRRLSPDQYRVLREGGSPLHGEPPLPGRDVPGLYECAACGTPLFDAADRDDGAHDGRAGFTHPITPERITAHTVAGDAPARVAIRCAACNSHLGLLCLEGPVGGEARYRPHPIALTFEPRS